MRQVRRCHQDYRSRSEQTRSVHRQSHTMFNHSRFGQSRLSRIRCGVGRLWLGPWRCQRLKLSSRTVHQPLEALYSTILALQLCNIAAVSASMKCTLSRIRIQDRLREESECGEVYPSRKSRLSKCSLVGPRVSGDVSIRESYSRSQCRLRLLAIAALGQHHVQLARARRAKCHTYRSTLLPPGPSRVVVDRALQLGCSSSSVIIPHLVLPYPCACFFLARSHTTKHIRTLTTLRTRPRLHRPLDTRRCPDFPALDTALLCHAPFPQSLHVPPAWDCACKPLDPSKSHARDRRHQSRDPATTTINQDNHDHIKKRRRRPAKE